MARRMADPGFRQEQHDHRYDEHVEPVNRLVDRLREQYAPAPVPYLAPHHGGREARVLALFGSPGAGTDPARGGSGFTSTENDDPGSERLGQLLADAGIDPWLVVPWHAVPHQLAEGDVIGPRHLRAGRAALEALLPLLPRLRSVVLHGREVEPVWAGFALPNSVSLHGVRVEPVTFSTGDQAVAQHRASRLRKLAATYDSVAQALT